MYTAAYVSGQLLGRQLREPPARLRQTRATYLQRVTVNLGGRQNCVHSRGVLLSGPCKVTLPRLAFAHNIEQRPCRSVGQRNSPDDKEVARE